MKHLSLLLALLCIAAPALAGDPHPFDAKDLVMMDRVSDPHLSPDGSAVAFSVRATDYDANKGVTSIWTLDLAHDGAVPQKLTPGNSPRWSADGKYIYFLSAKSGMSQLWRVAATGGDPEQLTSYPLDVNYYKLSPDGTEVLL